MDEHRYVIAGREGEKYAERASADTEDAAVAGVEQLHEDDLEAGTGPEPLGIFDRLTGTWVSRPPEWPKESGDYRGSGWIGDELEIARERDEQLNDQLQEEAEWREEHAHDTPPPDRGAY